MHRRAIQKKKSGTFRSEKVSSGDLPGSFFQLPVFLSTEVALCVAAIILMSVFFVISYRASLWLVTCSIPFSILAGYTMFFLERRVVGLHRNILDRGGRIQAGFLAFFIFLLLGMMVFLLLLSYPMGWAADWLGYGHLSGHYGRWAVNLGIVVALSCWLRCVVGRLSSPSG